MTLRNVTNLNREMLDYLPKYYEDIPVVNNLLDRESDEFKELNRAIKDVLDQFFVDTATWGIGRWERITDGKRSVNLDKTTFDTLEERKTTFGEIDNTNWSLLETMYPVDLERRRSNIKAKLRGSGTVTTTMIKNVAESFAFGEVSVIEQPETYTIVVRFIDSLGVPAAIEDIKNAIREVIPAHLALEFEFTYVSYNELKTKYLNYDTITTTGKPYSQILVDR